MSEEKSKLERILDARMALKKRFEAKMAQTPAASDDAPQGSGPKNRHGMPKLPPGQHITQQWPVLDLGMHPEISLDQWQLTIDGACDNPVTLSWAECSTASEAVSPI